MGVVFGAVVNVVATEIQSAADHLAITVAAIAAGAIVAIMGTVYGIVVQMRPVVQVSALIITPICAVAVTFAGSAVMIGIANIVIMGIANRVWIKPAATENWRRVQR